MVGSARALALGWAIAAMPALADESLVARVACRAGAPNGAFELRGHDGSLRGSGAFAQGSKTGTFIFWTAGGARSAVVPYDHDVPKGTVALWYTASGREIAKKLEAPYDQGSVHGVVRTYYADGRPRTECRYDHGSLVDAQAWDYSGRALAEGQARVLAARDLEANGKLLEGLESMIARNLPHCE